MEKLLHLDDIVSIWLTQLETGELVVPLPQLAVIYRRTLSKENLAEYVKKILKKKELPIMEKDGLYPQEYITFGEFLVFTYKIAYNDKNEFMARKFIEHFYVILEENLVKLL